MQQNLHHVCAIARLIRAVPGCLDTLTPEDIDLMSIAPGRIYLPFPVRRPDPPTQLPNESARHKGRAPLGTGAGTKPETLSRIEKHRSIAVGDNYGDR